MGERVNIGRNMVDKTTWNKFKAAAKKRGLALGWLLKQLIFEWLKNPDRKFEV